MRRLLIAALLLAAFCLGAALSYFNWTDARFHYLAGELEAPQILLLLAAFVLGAVTLALVNALRFWGLSIENRRLNRRLRDAEGELRNLRNLPLPTETAAAPAAPAAPPPPPNAG